MNGYFVVPRFVEELPPKERFVYTELLRVAVFKPEGITHKEYQRHVPQGAWILSYRQLAELVGYPHQTVHRVVKSLSDKELVNVVDLGKIKGRDGNQPRRMFQIINYDSVQTMGHTLRQHSGHPAGHDMRHPLLPDQAIPEAEFNGVPNEPRDTHLDSVGDTVQDTKRDKKNQGTKNEGAKNERKKNQRSGDWRSDVEYLHIQNEGNWDVCSHPKIYGYYKQARQERSAEELLNAWNEYFDEKGTSANLVFFLTSEHRDYPRPSQPTPSRFVTL